MTVDQYGPGRMTYDLRRLRLHGLIERIPHPQRFDREIQRLWQGIPLAA